MPEVVTLGETMVLFSPEQNGPLRYVYGFQKRMAGSESNVAIGLSRLGHSAGWMSRLGRDEFGAFLLREIRGEGVDVSRVAMDRDAPTGVMFKEILEGRETRVYYYRRGSAASRMIPGDLDEEYIGSARILHITGITPALSPSCLETIIEAVEIARTKGLTVSFDPNIRLKLWSREQAAQTLRKLLPSVDILLPGLEEARILMGMQDTDQLLEAFFEVGIKTVALKLGEEGCIIADKQQKKIVKAFTIDQAIDPIGAGDAFAAGFLSGVLEEKSPEECGRMANAMGAFAVTTRGDIEGLPTREELDAFVKGQEGISR